MINLNAPINTTTGYGITSTNVWRLLREKTDIALFPIGGNINLESRDLESITQNDVNNSFVPVCKSNPCLKIWHQHDLFNRIGGGKYSALTFFELDSLQPNEVASLNHPDKILVASGWAKTILENHGIPSENIGIVPLGVDLSVFNPENLKKATVNPELESNGDKYVFINVGKWEVRKGHDLLVNVFNEAFTEKDNVELWMVNDNPFLNQQQINQWHQVYKSSKLGNKIKIFPRLNSHIELAAVMNKADCGIYLSRGEGWNNEVMETMALNKPVILTSYSAHTQYSTPHNSYLIDIDSTEPANDGIWFKGQGNWAKVGIPQIEQAIEYMREVKNNNIRTNKNGLKTAQKYTWQNTADTIWKYMTE